MDPYSQLDPVMDTSTLNDSSLIKCRTSTFLISMKSPSLNPIRPVIIKSSQNARTQQISAQKVDHPSISSGSSLEVSRLRNLIFNDDREVEYQRILQAKNQEIQTLRAEVKRKLNVSQSSTAERQIPKSEAHEEALVFLRKSMNYALEKCHNVKKIFLARNAQFLELVSTLDSMRKLGVRESDVLQLKMLLANFSTFLSSSGDQALELAEAQKLIQEKNIENVQLSSRLEKVIGRCDYFQQRLAESQARSTYLADELKSKNKDLHSEENKNNEQGKRVFVLNKLVKALKSKGNRQEDQNNYKTVINELVKEIEGLKRIIANRDKEIAHLKESNEMLRAKVASFGKKIEILQMNMSQKRPEEEPAGIEQMSVLGTEIETFSLFKDFRIPSMLDYRSQSLSARMTNLFMDLENHGPEVMLSYLRDEANSPEERSSIISTLSVQYVSYHDFAESLNTVLFHLAKIATLTNINEVLTYFAGTFSKIFDCEEARIWLDDKLTGILSSSSEKGDSLRAISGRGLLGKAMESMQPVNKITEKNLFLFEFLTDPELRKNVVDGALLVPLEPASSSCKMRVIIEYSGFRVGGKDRTKILDLEYFAIIIRLILRSVLGRLEKEEQDSQESKLNELYEQALVDLCKSQSDFTFSEGCKHWVSRLFNVSIASFFFCDNSLLIRHLSPTLFEELAELGVAGRCAQNLKPLLAPNLRNSPFFDSKVDLSTLMTVLTFPIIEKASNGERKCLAIVQIPIKESPIAKSPDFQEVRLDLERKAMFFGDLVGLALKYFRRSWG